MRDGSMLPLCIWEVLSVSTFLHVLVSLLRLQKGPSCHSEEDSQLCWIEELD